MEVEKREDSAQKPMQKKRVNISLYKAQRVQPPHLLQVAIFYYWFHIRERIRIGTFFCTISFFPCSGRGKKGLLVLWTERFFAAFSSPDAQRHINATTNSQRPWPLPTTPSCLPNARRRAGRTTPLFFFFFFFSLYCLQFYLYPNNIIELFPLF